MGIKEDKTICYTCIHNVVCTHYDSISRIAKFCDINIADCQFYLDRNVISNKSLSKDATEHNILSNGVPDSITENGNTSSSDTCSICGSKWADELVECSVCGNTVCLRCCESEEIIDPFGSSNERIEAISERYICMNCVNKDS